MINHSLFASGRNLAVFLLAGMAVSGLSSCKDDDTNYLIHPEVYQTKMVITLDIDDMEEAYPDTVIYYPEGRAGNRAPGRLPAIPEGYTMHYVVSVTNAEGVLRNRVVSETPDVVFNLSPGDYKVFAWADFVPVEGRANHDHWYFTDEMQEMLLKEKYAYQGSEHAKKAFAGTKELTVLPEAQRSVDERVTLSAPMGRFQILATKEATYEVGSVRVSYTDGIWAAHNLLNDSSTVRWKNVRFFTPHDGSLGKALAFDYILTNAGEPETFPMRIDVFDTDGYLRASARNVRVPIKRGYLTTVRGDFLNMLEEDPDPQPDPDNGHSGGAIGIDPGFESSYTITITK